MLELFGQIEEAVTTIRAKWDKVPKAGIILGTGLGSLVKNISHTGKVSSRVLAIITALAKSSFVPSATRP